MTEWIPVTKDNKPEIGQRVLIFHRNRSLVLLAHLEVHGALPRWMIVTGELEDTTWFSCHLNNPENGVTHWRPLDVLPLPYEGEYG